MKLKQRPEDFRVEELTAVRPGAAGDYALYRLTKAGWTTPDAVQVVRRRWDLDARRVSFGGLKDRHAETAQFISVYRGPKRDLTHQRIAVAYLGQVVQPFTARDIAANRFAVTVRDFTPAAEAAALTAVREVEATGLPNYFDDQRFGSVGGGQEFVGREMVRGRFEEALRLALTAPYEFDRADQQREKETLLAHWGDWPACRADLPPGHARDLVAHLAVNPGDFRGAVGRLRPELGGLYLAAYQSFLWNRVLDRWLRDAFPADALGPVRLRLGEVAAPLRIPAEVAGRWNSLSLPLPSARLKADPAADWSRATDAVLAEEGLTLATLKVPGLREPFFSKGDRAGCVRPAGATAEPAADDRHPGRRKVLFRFDLPRGSYATLFVKRVTSGPAGPPPVAGTPHK